MAKPDSSSSLSQAGNAAPSKATDDALLTVDQNAPAGSSTGTELSASAHSSINDVKRGIYDPRNKAGWLSSTYIGADGPGDLTVDDFLKVKASTHEIDAYWKDVHINWALKMIRRKHEGLNHIYIARPEICHWLYLIGVSPEDMPDRNSSSSSERKNWEDNYAVIAKDMTKCNLVILPINNGYKQRVNRTTFKVGDPISGAHWSFVVVDRRDRENPTAHYLDGMVGAEQGQNGKWKVKGISINGGVAGKVLRGFENLLELEKGRFAARTLKFVPHQYHDNASRDTDYGSCGPHLYGFMDHILTNKTRLMDPGMDVTFNNPATKKRRADEFGFHSMATRARFAEELMEERRRQEAAQPLNHVDNLTPHVLRSLITVDGLISLSKDTAASARSAARGHAKDKKRSGNKSLDDDDDEDGSYSFGGHPPIPKSILREAIERNPAPYKNMRNRADQYHLAYSLLRDQQQAAESKKGSTAPGKNAKNPNKTEEDETDIYVGSARYRNVPRDDQAIFPPEEPPEKLPGSFRTMPFAIMSPGGVNTWLKKNHDISDRITERDKKGVWLFTARAMLHFKFKKSFLPLPDAEIERIWSHDEQVFSLEQLAALKEEYAGEANQRVLYGIMRERLMRHYQGNSNVDALLEKLEKYKVHEPFSGTKRKRSAGDGSNGSDGPEGDDSGNKSGGGKRVRRGKDKPTDPGADADEGDDFYHGYHNTPESAGEEGSSTRPGKSTGKSNKKGSGGGAAAGTGNGPVSSAGSVTNTAPGTTAPSGTKSGSAAVKSSKSGSNSKSTSLTTPRPTGLLDFRTMESSKLRRHMTREMRNDPRYRNVLLGGRAVKPNDISIRAMCFVDVAEQRFADESDADCANLWCMDSLVFTEDQRRTGKCTLRSIRKMMGQHYHAGDLAGEDDGDQGLEDETEADTEEDEDEDRSAVDELEDVGGDQDEMDDVDSLFAFDPSIDGQDVN